VKVVQTGHPTSLLVEKGNIGVTLYTVVWPGLDFLSTHRLIFLFQQHSTATCLMHGSERLPRASAQKMSSAWMFLIRWNQYYQTSFPIKHYSPFPCSERLEGKEYRRNCVPTKILHQTCESNATLAVLNLMSLVKMKPCHCYKPWQV